MQRISFSAAALELVRPLNRKDVMSKRVRSYVLANDGATSMIFIEMKSVDKKDRMIRL